MKTVYMIENGNVFFTSHPEFHTHAKRLTQAEGKRLYREQNRQQLLSMLAPGSTVYTSVKNVSRSGMSRTITLHVVQNGSIRNITGYAAHALGWKGDASGLKVGGCGMDMGFLTVYTLGRTLWPDGLPTPHGTRNGKPDYDGGYALKHEWL